MRSRDRAEGLIGFMLGDFRAQLEPLGKLDLLENVGDKAMDYFSSLDERDITDESLLRRAEALRQIGDVRLSLGEFTPALAAFQESLQLSRRLSSRRLPPSHRLEPRTTLDFPPASESQAPEPFRCPRPSVRRWRTTRMLP